MTKRRIYDTTEYRKARVRLRLKPCALCYAPPPSTVDHIKPASKWPEGTPLSVINHPSNLRPLCGRCNSSLGGRLSTGPRRRRWRNRRW